MSLFKVFDVSGSGMNAQQTRLNTVASNLANSETVAGSPEQAYRSRQPVFASVLQAAQQGQAAGNPNHPGDARGTNVGVKVEDIVQSDAPVQPLYMPNHPQADEQGYVYRSNVNPVEEMTNMISASRSYQNNVEVMNTSKELLLQTLRLGQQ
ncbi:flagellar basal body rod protein FlgC [Alkalilimnicola ehrlichii MLHE-1]|uniref:Flagellar basal-body rod protein FlgC n=1 Tax=Alkalilimnicola ehrlichii (strain ATCC BAA-1101 / DSM 17681 / MLHE-1) TaxID=187272 RepID=Q0AA89_ALKEH|nr:flagellar basal body rod protein FlgC [Alkalilimnicola ehrlichii]ABI56248.1 flagellar basal-body rod protein FlgC [Alkalilimnicola ehrlichii MLHE-1]